MMVRLVSFGVAIKANMNIQEFGLNFCSDQYMAAPGEDWLFRKPGM